MSGPVDRSMVARCGRRTAGERGRFRRILLRPPDGKTVSPQGHAWQGRDAACQTVGRERAMDVGTRIDEVGTLIRDGGAFYLRRDLGGRFELALHRTPVDLVEKRVRLIGTIVGPDRVDADGVAPA